MNTNDIYTRNDLVSIATKMLKGEFSLLEGSVLIDSLIDTDKDEDDFLLPIKGIVSQAGDMVQEKYKIDEFEYIDLTKYENDLKEYFNSERSLILKVCKEIVNTLVEIQL